MADFGVLVGLAIGFALTLASLVLAVVGFSVQSNFGEKRRPMIRAGAMVAAVLFVGLALNWARIGLSLLAG